VVGTECKRGRCKDATPDPGSEGRNGQCGGMKKKRAWTKACTAGYYCKRYSDYYSKCVTEDICPASGSGPSRTSASIGRARGHRELEGAGVPDSLPVKCEERVAIAWGDPHFVTFDGLKYNCQGEGEFTLMKTVALDSNDQPKFEVQGRFLSFDKRKITVTRGLAIKEEGAPTIQLNVPSNYDKQCPISLFVGKHKRELFGGTGVDEVIVRQVGSNIVVFYPKTRLQFVVMTSKSTKYGCFLSVKACLPDDYRPKDKIIGLLGTPDEDPTNEFMKADGSDYEMELGSNRKYKENYDYCTQEWCVRDARKSIFAYEMNESYQQFNKCGDKYDGAIEKCLEAPPEWLEEICSSEDKRCVYEGCAGGEAEAKMALETEFELNDETGCGILVDELDFEDKDESDWGLIEQDPVSKQFFLGSFQSDSGMKEFVNIPTYAYYLTVEFLLHEIDDWGKYNRNSNRFWVSIAGKKFNLDTFEDDDSEMAPGNMKSGFKSGIYWKRKALSEASNMGYNDKHKDQIHKVTIKVPRCYFKDSKLQIGFDVTMAADKDHVSVGVNDLKIIAHPRKCRDVRNFGRMKEMLESHAGEKKRQEGKEKREKEEDVDAVDFGLENLLEQASADLDESSPVECRTAFAYHSKLSRSFKEMGFVEMMEFDGSDINWGWSSGPLLSSNYAYSFDVYAEGETEEDPMTLVGAMTVGYDGKEAVVTVDAAEGLWLNDVQAYVGTTRLPLLENGSETMDPSEYPIVHERMSLSRSFVVSDFEDESIYVVAEATVCGVFHKAEEQLRTGIRGGDSWFQSARGLLKGLAE